MGKRVESMVRDLRCEQNNHPYRAEILQTLHTVESGEITNVTTTNGALEGARCWCGSLPKDPSA